ncbi:MAG: N-acetylglucosamine kinase [Bacteroidota bacterium]
MLFIVDGGSTKADWLLSDRKKVTGRFSTIGFNPYFHSSEFIYKTLSADTELGAFADVVDEVRYFGAGCSSPEKNKIVEKGLKQYFTKAKIIVDHDLLACAYATCGDEAGIACIIGTGSNSCYFDGEKVHEHNYGLGYILGDEGSGSYYGKKLVTSFLYKRMPQNIYDAFRENYQLDKSSIVRHVYNEPNANVWLASLSRFLSDYSNDPWIHELIIQGMYDFMDLYVVHYENYKELPVHFVGSLAHVFESELREAAAGRNLKVGKIIKQPIEELMNYFLKKQ